MAIILPSQSLVLNAYAVLVGETPGNTAYKEHQAYIAANGEAAYKSALNGVFAGSTTASLAATLLANLGLSALYTQAQAEAFLTANASNRVAAMMDLASQLYNYSGTDTALVAAHTAYQLKVNGSYAYSENAANLAGTGLSSVVTDGGQPFTLTTGIDTIVGTAGNDTITALLDVAATSTLTALDSINGGQGSDVLNLNALTAVISLPAATVSAVETLNIRAADDFVGSVSGWTGLTAVNVTQGAAVTLTAAATTAVAVSGATGTLIANGGSTVALTAATADQAVTAGQTTKGAAGAVTVTHTSQGDGNIVVNGGTNVTVTATKASVNDTTATDGKITVGLGGAAADLPTGAIVVTTTGAASTAATDGTIGAIAVKGGSSVTVTQTATSSSAAAAEDTTGATITQAAVAITGGASTTSATVNQSAAVTEVAGVAAVAGATETQKVTFVAMAATETIVVNGLTFTAAKTLTAAQAAAAFANLTDGATHGSAPAGNGVYSGTFSTIGGSTGAVTTASGVSTVTFTSTAKSNIAALTVSDTAAAVNVSVADLVAGSSATALTTGVLGVVGGAVTVDGNITGADVLATVSLNGYGAGSTIASDALTSLTLANSAQDLAVTNATATTLALGLNAIDTGSTLNIGSTYTTLNVTATGADSDVTLTAGGVQTLTVAGEKAVDLTGATLTALKTVTVSGSAGLTVDASGTNVTAVNTAATTGKVTATVDASKATYTGGAGVDAVTLSSTTVSKAVDTGAGNDTVNLASGTTSLTVSVVAGDGTDTLKMDAADAATVSAANVFETRIDGFEKLSLGAVANGSTSSVDLSNVDDISYVISANSTGTGITESSAVTFQNLARGASTTVAGLTLTVKDSGGMTAAEVATAFASIAAGGAGVSPAKGTFSGTLTGFASGTASTATVTFTSSTATSNVTDITSSSAALAAGTAVIATDTPDVTESSAVTFVGLGEGESITVGGLTLALGADADTGDIVTISAANVAAAFASLAANAAAGNAPTLTGNSDNTTTPTITWTGNLTGFSSGTASGTGVTFTGSTADVSLADITVSDTASAGNVSVSSTTDGYASETVSFQNLAIGQSVTVGGLTATALTARTAAQVATAFASLAAGAAPADTADIDFSGSLDTSWASQAASGSNVEFRTVDAAAGYSVDETDLTQSVNAAGSAPTALTVSTTQGAAVAGAGALTLTKMANAGTLELTAAGSGATVTMTDATSTTADVFNIVTKVNAADLSFGTVAVAGVETVNITATDTTPTDDDGVATISKATLTVSDSAVKAIVVTGQSDLDLTAAGASLTSVDASAATGKLTFSSAVNSAVVKGGSAADTLTATGNSQTLNGGDGADVLTATGDLATLTGGAGKDTFDISDKTTNVNSYATITDLAVGDAIKFGAAATAFVSAKVTLGATAVFQDLANAAITNSSINQIAWFQYGTDTYAIQNVSGSATAFQNNSDIIVKITGLVDLSTAAFSSTADTLVIV